MSAQATKQDTPLLRVDEAAEYMKCSVSTIRRYIRQGDLKAAKLGKMVVVRQDDLEAMLAPVKPSEAAVIESLAAKIAATAPVLSAEGKAKLAELLYG